jgi:hypothetical protein
MTSSDPSGDPANKPQRSGFVGFFVELRRRKVVRKRIREMEANGELAPIPELPAD